MVASVVTSSLVQADASIATKRKRATMGWMRFMGVDQVIEIKISRDIRICKVYRMIFSVVHGFLHLVVF